MFIKNWICEAVSDHCCFSFPLCLSCLIKQDVFYWRIFTCFVVITVLSSALGHRSACWSRSLALMIIIIIHFMHNVLLLHAMSYAVVSTDYIANVPMWPWPIAVILTFLKLMLIMYNQLRLLNRAAWFITIKSHAILQSLRLFKAQLVRAVRPCDQ